MLEFVKEFKIPKGYLDKVILAVEEVVVNIIRHGYPQKDGLIEMSCEETAIPGLKITIIDSGIPFNPTVQSFIPSQERLGGVGIHLYRELMDKVEYIRSNDQNRLTLTKYFN